MLWLSVAATIREADGISSTFIVVCMRFLTLGHPHHVLLFLYTRTRTYHTISSIAGFFCSDLNFLRLSVYIAVLGGDLVSDHVWQVRNKSYLFARVRCLRDLRGDIEAGQDVPGSTDRPRSPPDCCIIPCRTVRYCCPQSWEPPGKASKAPRSELSKIWYLVFCVSQLGLGLNPSLSELRAFIRLFFFHF